MELSRHYALFRGTMSNSPSPRRWVPSSATLDPHASDVAQQSQLPVEVLGVSREERRTSYGDVRAGRVRRTQDRRLLAQERQEQGAFSTPSLFVVLLL